MKYLFILIPFLLQAQSLNLFLMDDAATGFNPLTYDGNTIALFDGDKELTTASWGDQSGNNYDLTFANSPTINSASLNGHNTVTFNGTDEWGTRATTPSQAQPVTLYIVLKQITSAAPNTIIDSPPGNSFRLLQGDGTGGTQFTTDGSNVIVLTDSLTVTGRFIILTCIGNGANSVFRLDNQVSYTTGNAGTGGLAGLTLGVFGNGSAAPANVEIAYVLLRSAADDTDTQNLFIAYLKERFGL